jgi:hypothetical protein
MKIINGRRITNIPDAGAYGEAIIEEMKLQPGRRPVLKKPEGFEQIEPRKLYRKRDVLDRKGRPLGVTDIPDRTKGDGTLFGGQRSRLSKAIITEQVFDLQENLYNDERGLDFDMDNADWMVVPRFRLPQLWHDIARDTPLLIMFPTEYPAVPPIGCYMKASIPQSPTGHFYTQAFHQASSAPLDQAQGWKWFCVYVAPGSWRPAAVRKPGDWRHGDDLWTYMSLINEALASRD